MLTKPQRKKRQSSRRLRLEQFEKRNLMAVVAGDFNGDGFEDMAIGRELEAVDGHERAGEVEIIYGTSSGLDPAGKQVFNHESASVLGTADDNDRFGSALAAGDFNNDGFDDLAIGVSNDNDAKGAVSWGGAAGFCRSGSRLGLRPTFRGGHLGFRLALVPLVSDSK